MGLTPQQHTADFLKASGYESETIVSFLEGSAAADKFEATGTIIIGDAIYAWAESADKPTLYEVAKVPEDEEEPRVKVWRSINRRTFRRKLRKKIKILGREDTSAEDAAAQDGEQDG